MHYTDLVTDKTFFIMQDGTVKTYYKTQINNGTLEILVYDRESLTGVSPLNTQTLKTTLFEYSNEYSNKLKAFLSMITIDLNNKGKRLLYEYICHIWNGDNEKAEECYWEDCTLPEQFMAYMESLIQFGIGDPDTVQFFNSIYCEQELVYPRYNEKWLYNLTGDPSSTTKH